MTRTLTAAAALCLALLAPASPAVQAQPTGATPAASARVIVKFKADSGLLRKQAASAAERHAGQAQALGQRVGVALTAGAGVGERSQVVLARGMSSQALAERLARQADVEYAVPDQRKRISAVPNDPLYLTGGANGPAVGQWYLRAPDAPAATSTTTVVSSIDAEAAWNVSTGANSIVVAVLDTGIRFEHPDLKKIASGGNLLDGYDMVSDVDTANDGTLRDADASDPGDWLDQGDIDSGAFAGACTSDDISDSTWHGTQTAGLIGALTGNGIGIASVGRNVRILPVRVLGKCGGLDSDILAGMRWAAGIHVAGVPDNPTPAKVINLSLGGGTTCTAAYVSAVNEITARGVVIVASAGNSAGHAVSEPASCAGVIGVAGLRHIGTKVGFSDIGPEISISAPGGNCVNLSGACLYPIPTTSNAGNTSPAGSIYTDSFNVSLGTSFSAPLVAGTAALMLSSNAALTSTQVRSVLQSTARPFPTTGSDPTTPVCIPPTVGSADQLECYCTTNTCGAGMLDAGAAVASVAVLQSHISYSPVAPIVGETVTLSSTQSSAASGRAIVLRQWSLVDAGTTGAALVVSGDSVTTTTTTTAAGRFTVSLTVTDDANATATSTQSIDVGVTPPPPPPPPPPPSSDGGGAVGAAWLLALLAAVVLLAAHGRLQERG